MGFPLALAIIVTAMRLVAQQQEISGKKSMIEGFLFWLDLGLMIYLCWRHVRLARGEATDLGIFSFKEADKST